MKFAVTVIFLAFVLPPSMPARAMESRGATHAKAFPVTIVDDHHDIISITHRPRRIVTLDPRDTETAFALGLEKRVVGDSPYDGTQGYKRPFRYPREWPSPWGRDYPLKAPKLQHISGGLSGLDFNLETIASLHPDIVLALYSPSYGRVFAKIRQLGVKLIILDPNNLKRILRDIKIVGMASGERKHATLVTHNIRKELGAVDKRLRHVRSHPYVYYEIDASNPTQPFTVGPGSFMDQAITRAGGRNVARRVKTCSGTTCYPQFSLEELVRLDPQVIFLGDAAYGTTPASVRSRAGWATIAAVRAGRIYPFDDDLVSRAGPRIGIGIEKLARLIHPEAFKKKHFG